MMQRGRIVHILEAFTGGTRRHLTELLTGLPQWDQSAIVSTGRDKRAPAAAGRLREAGHRIDVIPMRRQAAPLADARALLRIIALLREQRPEIIHCHSAKAGILGRVAGVAAGVPIRIYSPHSLPFHSGMPAAEQAIYRTIERFGGFLSTAIVAVSPTEAREIRRARLITAGRLRMIPNGVVIPTGPREREESRRRLRLRKDGPLIVCVAHLRAQKAPLDWIRMAAAVRHGFPDAHFLWVGDGELKDQALAAASRSLGSAFHYIDYLADPGAAYQAADAFAMASLWEGFPYALLEAMSWGLPCAVTAVAGCQDIVQHGQNGLLSPPADPEALVGSVSRLLAAPDDARRMGENGQRLVARDYTLSQFLERYDRLYRELSAKNR